MNIIEIRHEIDKIDSNIIDLLSKRSLLVSEAGRSKKNAHEVRDQDRVEKVILKIKQKASKTGLDPNIAERIYRTIINCSIHKEIEAFNYELQDI